MKLFFQELFFGLYKFLTNSEYRKFLYMALVNGNQKRYHPTRVSFHNCTFEISDFQSFLWQFKEIFVEEYYKFETDSDSPLIYDCGANVGTSCLYFSQIYPTVKIKAFEADPKIAKILKGNLERNNIKNIEVHDKAVWINNDGIELGLEGADGSSIFIKNNRVKVQSIRLKDLLESEKIIDFLKLDIEGAELQVIDDCRNSLNNVKNIFIEFHSYKDQPQKLSEIIKILEEADFRYYFIQVDRRNKPFINKFNKYNPKVDLQLNIFAYKIN